jgi:hypothetical protein
MMNVQYEHLVVVSEKKNATERRLAYATYIIEQASKHPSICDISQAARYWGESS